jgi:DNA uptake protein ComE-like DNA-binding protein
MKRSLLSAALVVALAACGGGGDEGPEATENQAPAASAPADSASAAAPAPPEGALLDPNTAPREQLLAIPGVTDTVAAALVQGRPYADMLAVDRVLGAHLAPEQRKAVYGRLWKPLDLNRASGEEILLIPGVGPKMRHEFEEYRPYRSMEQFRREIGKYVDDDEVARLERYVTLQGAG